MKTKLAVLGSAAAPDSERIAEIARSLGKAIAARDLILLTGATTGVVHLVGKIAQAAGALHIGVSPGANEREHVERYELPVDACDAIIYSGFGLKGRNVVLIRSCDIAIFIAGSFGSLNEFTIAHDEGKIIGCLSGTGGVADEASRLIEALHKKTTARLFYDEDPNRLIETCLSAR